MGKRAREAVAAGGGGGGSDGGAKRPREEGSGGAGGAGDEAEKARRTAAREARKAAKKAAKAERATGTLAGKQDAQGGKKDKKAKKAKKDKADKCASAARAPAWTPAWTPAAVVPLGCRAVIVEGLANDATQGEVRALFPKATKVNVARGKARVAFLEPSDVSEALKRDGGRCGGASRVTVTAEDPQAVAAEIAAASEGREVFLKYLPYSTTEDQLRDFFDGCDIVGDIRLMHDPSTGKCKGIGWLTLGSAEGQRKALSHNGARFGGRNISVTLATNSAKWARGTVQDIGTHTPAMVDETLRALVLPDPDGVYVDGTFGRGGHSRAILSRLSPKGRLHAFDLDPEAILVAKQLEKEDSRFTIHHRPFGDMVQALGEEAAGSVSGVFLDLGISSPQFDAAGRGFRPEADGPLDLRFDQTRGEPASALLKRIGREELIDILVVGGESDKAAARRIADAIMLAVRAGTLPERTRPFAELVARAKGKEYQAMHPAKMTFQALRIHLNQEFEEMTRGMCGALELLKHGGRLGLLTWKYSECQLVMDFYREHEEARDTADIVRYIRESQPDAYEALRVQPAMSMDDVRRPSQREIQENSRSRSALLHVLRKTTRGMRLHDVEVEAYKLLGWGAPPPLTPPPAPRPW